MILRWSALVLASFLCAATFFHPVPCRAQAESPSQQTPFTFRADTHIVLTDVTVTDANGNPVHGLPQSAFRILDNKQPQEIASFEEHSGTPAVNLLPASTPGVYSNDYLLHLPPVLNIVVIDIANLDISYQMYLNLHLTKFLNELPDGQPLAIYLRAGEGCFLMQNFTSDRKLLLDALHRAIPRFAPNGRRYLTEFDTLQQIALSLSQLPGRKNVLWFSGGSTQLDSSLRSNPIFVQNEASWRDLYDLLDQDRIAIYPIDARGLTGCLKCAPLHLQFMAMNDVAQATGGHAFYNDNGLKEVAQNVLSSDGSFYTLTYSPANLRFDNKWHKIHVEVSGAAYRLSYRSGYFADGSLRKPEEPPKPRTRLLANGEIFKVSDSTRKPIVFQAIVLPASDPSIAGQDKPSGSLPLPAAKKGSVPFAVRYTVPMSALSLRRVDGKLLVDVGVAAVVLNREGGMADSHVYNVTMVLKEESYRHSPDLSIVLDQKLNLTKDAQFLNLGVWDQINGRFGSIEIPLTVPKPEKQ